MVTTKASPAPRSGEFVRSRAWRATGTSGKMVAQVESEFLDLLLHGLHFLGVAWRVLPIRLAKESSGKSNRA
jgi:hypothetical protein